VRSLNRTVVFTHFPRGRTCRICHPGEDEARSFPQLQRNREFLEPLEASGTLTGPELGANSRTRFTTGLSGWLKAFQTYAHDLGFVVKTKSAIGFVAIPQLLKLPFTVLIRTLFSGDDFAAHPW
jgi:hypothetical protein